MSDPAGDSGLRCPWCDYNLTALTSSRCPECGKTFVVVKPGMMAAVRSAISNSMSCPECGHNNTALMPRACRHCGRRFTLLERIFGVGGRIG
jgi:primosomal protein N'